MIGLGFRGSDTLKKKNSSDGHDDVIKIRHYIWIINSCRYCGYARRYYGYARRYRFLKKQSLD
jgi:hypothetical protein